MRYHNITKADMLNGEGLRVVLWTSGCLHHCPACQNALTWDENDGLPFDDEAINEIYQELEKEWCSGLTLSGGDPLFPKSRKTIRDLVTNVKKLYPTKTIWSYTGYTWEELMEQMETDEYLKDILNNIDVLLEGRFVLKLASEKVRYVGSSNQRIIDVKKSLEKGEIVLYIDNKDLIKNNGEVTMEGCACRC